MSHVVISFKPHSCLCSSDSTLFFIVLFLACYMMETQLEGIVSMCVTMDMVKLSVRRTSLDYLKMLSQLKLEPFGTYLVSAL